LGMAGWTVVGGFGRHGPCLAESPLYLGPWDEQMCAFAPEETINNRDLKKKEKRQKKKRKKTVTVGGGTALWYWHCSLVLALRSGIALSPLCSAGTVGLCATS